MTVIAFFSLAFKSTFSFSSAGGLSNAHAVLGKWFLFGRQNDRSRFLNLEFSQQLLSSDYDPVDLKAKIYCNLQKSLLINGRSAHGY